MVIFRGFNRLISLLFAQNIQFTLYRNFKFTAIQSFIIIEETNKLKYSKKSFGNSCLIS